MVKSRFTALLYGWIVIFAVMLVASLILALLLRFTTIGSSTLDWVTLTVSLIALFSGGVASGIKGKEKGWILGGSTGLGFILFVLLYQYLGFQKGFSADQMITQGGFLIAALFGGILGVNLSNEKKEQT
ncbi:TIGR04086 family membrane protein [Aquibacillus sp. 3ASR75-11]|uniref:TIGR04086 family membrane protein n=1 Tax=Terrihalobacillus insolitus TaxID=2950438 RepID=A0A9X3WSI0_9BACI|nr:TIGR04086 family membrane protein [Terrihalobacillus insolitus]MDC3412438.1 TIGR04086 family membrane protein [Terrihalobacillus insolitus]MDC3423858.1 TIGR04086 family membrane protein [Terrihalobacillus insolitus]